MATPQSAPRRLVVGDRFRCPAFVDAKATYSVDDRTDQITVHEHTLTLEGASETGGFIPIRARGREIQYPVRGNLTRRDESRGSAVFEVIAVSGEWITSRRLEDSRETVSFRRDRAAFTLAAP